MAVPGGSSGTADPMSFFVCFEFFVVSAAPPTAVPNLPTTVGARQPGRTKTPFEKGSCLVCHVPKASRQEVGS